MSAILNRLGGKDPSDDPLVAEWDSIVLGQASTVDDIDSATANLLRLFQELDPGPQPAAGFIDRLENELTRKATPMSNPSPRATAATASAVRSPLPIRTPGRRAGTSSNRRWSPLRIAAAALVIFVLGSVFFLDQEVPSTSPPPPAIPVAIPAAVMVNPDPQTMVEFDFDPPMWDMPEATTWTHMDFTLIKIDAGKSFSTDAGWYTSTSGPFLMVGLSGVLEIQPVGAAIVHPAGGVGQPYENPSGQLVALGPNDAIVFSIQDTAVGTNVGDGPAFALFGLTGSENLSEHGGNTYPTDVWQVDIHAVNGMTPLTATGARVSIQRLELLPLDTFVMPHDAYWEFLPVVDPNHISGLRIAAGAFDDWSPAVKDRRVITSSDLAGMPPGAHTLFNFGEEPIDIYFLVFEAPVDAAPPEA